jgi:branched-chain amino acid transport system ATP-binding protein
MMTEDAILEVKNLDFKYGDFQALYDVSMSAPRGKIVSLIGSNGAGKSTLLHTIVGYNNVPRGSGSIVFNGDDITGLSTNKIVSKGVTLSPEGSSIFENMSIEENLLMGAYLPGARKRRKESFERVYRLFPVLKEKEKQTATFLSGGQRQMLAIGRAIMSNPRLLICDELSLGLAPVVVKDIYRSIREINKLGVTVLLVEQEVKRSLKYADYSYVMVKGRIVMEGVSSELPVEEVKGAYLGVEKYA